MYRKIGFAVVVTLLAIIMAGTMSVSRKNLQSAYGLVGVI